LAFDGTDLIIKEISDNTNNVCFVLMGIHAKDKKHLINSNKHCIVPSNADIKYRQMPILSTPYLISGKFD